MREYGPAARKLVGCFGQSESNCGFDRRAATTACAHLILRSIVQSALADCAIRLEDEVGTHGPPSWFETARALTLRSERSERLEGARASSP